MRAIALLLALFLAASSASEASQYWCPMHPDVRADVPGKCSICSMALVKMPPAKFETYPVDLRATATVTGARLRLAVKSPSSGATVRAFAIVHERPMHLFVVGNGLEFFAHEHPVQQPDGVFMIDLALPKPGPYMAIAEFQPEGASAQMFQQVFTTGSAFDSVKPPAADTVPKSVEGLRFTLDTSKLKAGSALPLVVNIADAATGGEVPDLEPYLGARAHMLLVSSDLTEAIHGHPEDDGRPALTFTPIVPRPGDYKMWIQVQRRGAVVTVPFWIRVGS